MNTLLSLLALSCLCGLSAAFFGKDFFTGNTGGSVRRRDCQWMAWGPVGKCTPRGHGYIALQTRHQVSAKNGGKDCVGSNRRYVSCTELEFIASTFLEAVTTQSRTKTTGGSGDRHLSFRGSSCATNFTNAAGNIRMLGKSCHVKRRIRSANGNIEVDEEPLMERIRKKRQTPPMRHRDMLFVLDESGSIGTTNFKRVVKLARALVENLCESIVVGQHNTRISVMGFDSTQHPMLDFKEIFNQGKVLTHMDTKVTYTVSTHGSTCLNNALEYARTKMFHLNKGARLNSNGVEQTIVLITDGCANCAGDTSTKLDEMGKQLENDGISIIVYYIGTPGTPCEKKLFDLLSPDTGRCFDLISAPTWATLDGVSAYIEDPTTCAESWIGAPSCA